MKSAVKIIFGPLSVLILILAIAFFSYSPFRLICWILNDWIEKNKYRYFSAFGFSLVVFLIIGVGISVGHFTYSIFSRIILHFATIILVFFNYYYFLFFFNLQDL
jgi:hypothetical protein